MFCLRKKFSRHKMKRIQSKKHKLWTYEINIISSSCFDDKRYVLDDGINKSAYFHKDNVTSCKKIKEIVIIEKDCDNWKILHKKICISNRMKLVVI